MGGSRDRHRQVRSAGLRVRRHRDRPQPAHTRPRGRRHLVGARRVPLRAAGDRARRWTASCRRASRSRSASSAVSRCLNLEGLWTRYEDPEPLFEEIAELSAEKATRRMQEIYAEPIKDELIGARIREIKDAGVTVVRVAHAAAGRAVREARARRRARHARDPGHGRLRRARVEDAPSRSTSRSSSASSRSR